MSILGYIIISFVVSILGLFISISAIIFRKKLALWLLFFMVLFGITMFIIGIVFGFSLSIFLVPRLD